MKSQVDPSAGSFLVDDHLVLQLVLDTADEQFLLVDKNLNIVFANKKAFISAREILGIEIIPGTPVLSLANPQRHAMLIDVYHQVLKGKELKTELQLPMPNGPSVFLENQMKPVRLSTGEVVAVLVSSRDITEKKESERSLQEAEERWRFALEGANQGVWDWNILTNECYYSNAYCALYGYEPGELNGNFSLWEERIHPEDLAKMQDNTRNQLQSREKFVQSTYRIKTKQGDYKWVEAKGMLLFDAAGEPYRMIGTHVDLTEKLQQEEELKKTYREIETTNERFNMMMRATSDLVWDWDVKNNSFYRGDEGLKKVYGVESNLAISTVEKWMMRVHPDDLEKVQHIIAELLQPHEINTFEIEYRFLKDDGAYSHVYDRGLILRDEKGSPVRIIGAAQNISDRKKLEQEILQKELDHKKILNKATIDSQEHERSEIGRELHDNVNQILTTTKLMLEMSGGANGEKDELIGKCIHNISAVINEIRELSRSLMNPSINDLGIIDSINDLAESINMTDKVQVICNFDTELEGSLNQNQKLATFRIVQESINNIIRHASASYAIINLHCEGSMAELVIEDDGNGFDAASAKRGAGLKNIENRVYLINGSFSLETEPGRGTRIIIRYPLNNND